MSPKNLFFAIGQLIAAVKPVSLLPVHDQQEAEDEAAEVREVRNAGLAAGHAEQQLDACKYEDEPFRLHGYRREEKGES